MQRRNRTIPDMSHKEIVQQATYWLRNIQRHTIVLTEFCTSTSETPDCFGFCSNSCSTLIECKASLPDFSADRKKLFRKRPEQGMGLYRYYMAPYGLIKPDEMPEKWGLIEISIAPQGFHKDITKKAEPFYDRNYAAEITLLVSILRRLEISTAVFVRQSPD